MIADAEARLQEAAADLARLDAEVRKVFIGQDELVRGVIAGLLTRGNLLIEGAPGLGKTLLVRVLAQALELRFSRIQFTPDLMPADITGTTTLVREDDGHNHLAFRAGPIFANVVLADEINRGTPKTQSALLEAMQEHAVTVGGERRVLDEPFVVLATQNPIEMEGTYPLPEAQLDRFLLKLIVGFPTFDELIRIGVETTGAAEQAIQPVLGRQGVLALQALVREVVIAPEVAHYAGRIVMATHPGEASAPKTVRRFVRYGASPRALQALLLAGRARALVHGRPFVSPDDVRDVAHPVLRHRIVPGFDAELEGVEPDSIVDAVLADVK